MPGLYGIRPKSPKKPPPKKKSPSCKDDWLKRITKDDDQDDNGSSQAIEIPSDSSEGSPNIVKQCSQEAAEEQNTSSSNSSSHLPDIYSFREEEDESPFDKEASEKTAAEDDLDDDHNGIPANLGSSISFHNPELSRALGPLNNPFRSTGWVKTRCGESPSGSGENRQDGNVDNDKDDSSRHDPMWGAPTQGSDSDDIAMFDDDPEGSAGEDSDVETGKLIQWLQYSLRCELRTRIL